MTDKKRRYRKTARAEQEAATRRRIVESAVELHGTIGPSRTSISALARRAGVRRSTVYRYFPDDAAIFAACSAHWLAENPLPNPAAWSSIAHLDARFLVALSDLYAYYDRNHRMIENILRDETVLPFLAMTVEPYRAYIEAVRSTLLQGRPLPRGRQSRVSAVIGHALSFSTWRSLCQEQGLERAEAVALMGGFLSAALTGPPARRPSRRTVGGATSR